MSITLTELLIWMFTCATIVPLMIHDSISVIASERLYYEELTPILINRVSLSSEEEEIAQTAMVNKGTKLVFSVFLQNYQWNETEIAYAVQIVDEQDYTRYIEIGSASINLNEEKEIDIDLPIQNEQSGRYKLQFFVLSDLDHPQVLAGQWFKLFVIADD